MGLQDFEVFVRERLRVWDENLDTSPGSPVDTQVVQPLLQRIGTDPFTLDASSFIVARLSQEFPDLAFSDGDAVSDLLAKPALLLWDPIIREIQRVKNMLSFRNPEILTTDEAEALGANLFQTRDAGSFARGIARIYFAQPQPINVTPTNFFTSRTGLHFFPTSSQSIKSTEMALNIEGDLYYFDINVIAEAAGDSYNIGPSELTSIANVTAAVRVTNKLRFRSGLPEEDAATFIGRVERSLTERSLVTAPGIAARLTESFPDVTRLNVVGFNDPEMQRDVITGGALGPIIGSGMDAVAIPDGTYGAKTRRLTTSSPAGFFTKIGPAGPVNNCVITLFDMFPDAPPVRDIPVSRVIDDNTIEITDQAMIPGVSGKPWSLRKLELTLSGIPGGILFPDGPNGSIQVPPDQVHIGGCTDMLVRGLSLDSQTLVLDEAFDDRPLLSGGQAGLALGFIAILDYTLGTNYDEGDQVYRDFSDAAKYGWSIEILEGAGAGSYRVLTFNPQTTGLPPYFLVSPTPPTLVGPPPPLFRWRLSNEIHIDLVDPKRTRVSGADGKSIQNVSTFTTTSGVDFNDFGVAVGDTLRVLNGLDKGDFTVQATPPPFATQVTVNRPFKFSSSGLSYTIFRPNSSGGVLRPLLRVSGVEILDSSGQPVGSKVPYAKPVQALSRSFQNAGNGIKVEVKDAILGLVSLPQGPGFTFASPGVLELSWNNGALTLTVNIPAGGYLAPSIVSYINTAANLDPNIGFDIAATLEFGGDYYIAILPFAPLVSTSSGTTANTRTVLFGDTADRTTRDIRSPSVVSWSGVMPTIDADLDSTWVLDGLQPGFYGRQTPGAPAGIDGDNLLRVDRDFLPELGRIVRVGSRSIGSARLYFLEPTSIEVDVDSVFSTQDTNGVILNFKPDPTMERQVLPPLPGGSKPMDGSTSGGSIFSSAGSDFQRSGVRVGDTVVIDYIPLVGTAALADPVPGLALRRIRLSLDNQPDKFVTFINDVGTPGAVSRKGVASQINSNVGLDICSIVEDPPSSGNFYLRFNPTIYLVVRSQPSAPASEANTLLGFSNVSDQNNLSPNAGEYEISVVAPSALVTDLDLAPATLLVSSSQQFKVLRKGEQRISSTAMETQVSEASLYYWDVELVSEGPGDSWNIDANQEMVVSGYRSDGYYLTTRDSNTTFSPVEDVQMVVSRSILEIGVDDDPNNATVLAGQKLSVSYENSNLIQNLQSFVSADTERVINDSPLARHLVPHFVRFDLSYAGGSLPSEIQKPVEDYINSTPPDVALESSDVQKIVSDKGATSITNPVDLMAVVYEFDRSVYLVRSSNSLTTGRLAAFIPDVINLTRRTS